MKCIWCLFLCSCSLIYGQDKNALFDQVLLEYEKQDALNGVVLVATQGQVMYHKAFGKANFEFNVPNTLDTKFEIASVSKHITAVIILQLRDEGKLSLDDGITKYLNEFPKEKGNKITIHQLLSHTSGLSDNRHIPDYDQKLGQQKLTSNELLLIISQRELLFEPGTAWSYSNFGYNLLAIIIERICKKPFFEVLNERIFIPSGMKNSSTLDNPGIIPKKATGYDLLQYTELVPAQYHDPSQQSGIGSIVTSPMDYFLYYTALTNGVLLSKKSFNELTTPSTYSEFESNAEVKWSYTLTLDHFTKSSKELIPVMYCVGSHYGAQVAAYHFYKERSLVLVFINRVNRPSRIFSIADDLSKILYDIPVELPKDSYVRQFAKDLKDRNITEAISNLKSLKSKSGESLKLVPRDLNRLGYYYLEVKKSTDIAIEIFKLNLEFFPNDPNLMDSLGEAYFKAGKRDLAIETLKAAVKLDPKNEHAMGLLKELGVH